MPKCIIDGKEIEFKAGMNLIDVAKQGGIEIPFFCYHPGLTVVAQCRMCSVEVEKMAKIQTACSTPAADGMIVHTQSERAKQAQKATMEFLLINHPLDCPICDKSGECDLQDNSYKHGDAYSRYTEERRTYMDLDMGPVIKKNMNRCIHCTRCIRFGEEVANIHEMVAVKRGNNTEITTIDGRPLETEYAGNYADICPTGSLTLKDFRFKKRVWYLKKTKTTCEGCSRGCSMEIHQDNNRIERCVPAENMEVNRWWLCDEGRFNFHYVQSDDRLIDPVEKSTDGLALSDWAKALDRARSTLSGKNVVALVGSDLTLEEAKLLQEVLPKQISGVKLFHFGTAGITSTKDDADEDRILKRKSKTSNLHGLEKLGYTGFTELPGNTDAVVVFRGGRAQLPELNKKVPVVGVGVFDQPEVDHYTVVLPSLTFAEKDGTVINSKGMEQKFARAIVPLGQSKAIPEILMLWSNSKSASGAA